MNLHLQLYLYKADLFTHRFKKKGKENGHIPFQYVCSITKYEETLFRVI